ncbi:MAG TPA: Ig-like domain-containing protein, partial [Methylomirabilota bacterium]|nr:Ig-like domain-containing protein [Methylomirabilota bacterium]
MANNSPPGSNSLYVVALDNAGLSWTSAVVRVAVLSEGVTIVVPEDGSIYVNPTSIPVMVLERLPSGAITNVEFFVDGVKFGESSMAPFTASWTNVTGGSHRFIAVGRDDSGRSYQSAPINVGVSQLIVPRGSVWKYLDDGSDQGTAWTAPDFDDNAWASGPGELGYGDGDEATVVSSGPDPNNRYVTTYFRHAFEVANPTAFQFLLVNLKRDDGAVLYVNGIEAARFNMPAGPITATTLAQNAQDDGATFFPAVLPASLLVEGRNVLAVEIHQTSLNSSDISFEMDLIGIPVVIRNLSPTVALTSPADNAVFLAPPSINLEATASDEDGSVAKVEFYAGATKVGEDGESPYTATWLNPPMGPTVLTAVAIDNQGAAQSSTGITVHVFDAVGTPFARVTSPLEGAVMEGPTNLLVSAFASAVDSVSRVEFRANGELFGEDDSAPYSAVWTAPFGTSALTAVAVGADGKRGTSAPVNVTITIPPTNTVAPTLVAQTPAPGAVVTNLTSISVTFSERVFHVDAADLLVNGVPATNVVGSGSNYTFSVAQPAFGTVTITWATGHGIEDFGYPANLPFDENGPGASWSFELVDRAPPVVVGRVPAAGATVTNLTEISVTFSEPVTGVDAADFLVNGVPAFGLSGGGASYTFNFQQPPAGTVNISWNPAHGIADLAVSPNPFNATGPGATWTLTLDTRTILVQSNANWRFIKGTAEASSPINAWRQPAFDDSGWSNALAPFYYGDPYNSAANPGTLLSDMQGNYSSIYLRRHFTVADVSVITNLYLAHQSDDGFIAWINGVEVLRYNMDAGEIPYNGSAPATAQEVGQAGAPYIAVALPNPAAYLVEGENLLAVHAFNNQPQTSSDFGFNAQLYTYIPDPKHNPPRVARLTPPAGEVLGLTEITVRFTEPVTGVDATDLLINGAPATGLSSTNAATYTFTFPQPPFGPATLTWIADPGIVDFDDPPKAFDGAAATFQYSVVNPAAPTVALQNPAAGASLTNLNQIAITFSEPVTGVDAEDLLINGAPALNVTGGGASYVFTLAEPPYGTVSVGWAADHGIRDLESPPNAFDGLRRGNFWSYALVDRTPPTLVQINPAPGAQVLNLRELTVRFSEPVIGVNASDLRINGASAITVTGTNDLYTFTFAQPNATLIHITWVNNHGITDRAPTPNAFDAAAPGATWSYTTPDTVAPTVGAAEPAPFITIRSLNQIRITFTEPVTGVDAADLLVNNQPAFALSGSGAGPYTFSYLPPTNGTVEVRWQPGHGIADLASPTPNPFPGGEWTYTLDPNATFAGRIVINEIMFNPESGRAADEWLELRNTSTQLINLTGWRLTRGVDFTFPNVSIRAGGYLVVAADTEAFRVLYPNVTNVVGGWSGQLANSDEEIQLETASGEIVSTVHYATEGDWARRERGHGAQRITRITREGTTATVTVFGHGYTANDRIHISGADQPEFNGLFAINVSPTSPSTFTITVPESTNQPPVTNATGLLIARHAVDDGASGWSWFSLADGFGRSLEQINPTRGLPVGQNWLASTNAGGTPGRANSVNSANIAPLILDVAHFPPVPRSTDPVTITARVLDESPTGVTNVTLYYRNHTTAAPGPFATTNLLDDGAHGDGLNRDGLYGATLPPAAHGTIIEFYVQATDNGGRTRTWPAPTWETNDTFLQLANALYQVDDEAPSPATAAMPTYRVIMTGTERATFPPAVRQSDAEANVTFISTDGEGTKVRYLGGLRVRGAGSRSQTPPNNRLNIPNDNRWNGYQAINLNGLYVHNQLIGAAVAERAALPAARARLIQYRINGVNPAPLTPPGGGGGAGYGAFVMVEPVNGDLAERLFPEDPAGNVYRASSGGGQGGGIHLAQLNHLGTNADSYLTAGYFKASNGTENDWTDLFNLTFAFSQNTLPLPDYVQMMETNVNVQLWMRYFALGTLINFGETSMFNGRGDDYALYRGLQDPRFVAIGHDFDTIFGQGDTTGTYPTSTNSSIFIMLSPPATGANAPNMPVLRRFLTNEHFAPLFFAEIKRLADTVFHPDQLGPLMDQYLNWPNGPTTATIQNMKTFAANRRRVVLSQIPLTLTVSNSLTSSNGFLLSPSGTATLFGTFHAIDSRRVLVNGSPSILSPWEGRWTNTVTLQPGLNRVLVQSLNSNEIEIARSTVDIWYDDGSLQTVSGALTSDTVWSAANGPYQVTGNVTINPGVTLTILPGTTVYLGPGVNVVVANGGTLIAEGTDTARIRFAAAPGSGATWGGLTINGGPNSPESRLAYVHFDNNGDVAVEVADGTVFLDHLTFGNTSRQYLSLDRASFVVQHCVFPATTGSFEPTHGSGGIKAGGRGIFRRNFFGKVQGYNDALDFTGGNRPGPILQVLNNVFMGSDDDLLDLDSTDAWIEGNIFLHVHRNGSPDSASAVSGGSDNADNSQITIVGNLFYDIDHAVNAKQTNFYTLINNTIVRQTKVGSQDTNTAVIILADQNEQGTFTSQGAGVYLEGNIIHGAENLTRHLTTAVVTFTNNIIHQLAGTPWSGPGGGNVMADPLLKRIPLLSETTNYTSWEQAQVLWDHFSLLPGSPAAGTGPNGRDKGGVIPLGVSLSGEPEGATPFDTATLRVGPLRAGFSIPAAGFPGG